MVNIPLVAGAVVIAVATAGSERRPRPSTLQIPEPLKIEHRELHEELSAATKLSGATGQAATHVAELLHPHFVAEEEYALPQLGLLSAVSAGEIPRDSSDAISLSDRLKAHLSQMLDEHRSIVVALGELDRAAKSERHPQVVRFVEKLKIHAESEEQVLYPAAILIGEHLKSMIAR